MRTRRPTPRRRRSRANRAGRARPSGTIQIAWAASTDESPPITYRIYRDGNPTSIGSTTATTFIDPGLTPGSTHTYTVDAVDSLANPSAMSGASASILVTSAASAIFSDDFSSGNFSNWTGNTRLTIDNATGVPAAPSARAQVTSQSASAYRTLSASPVMTACMSLSVNVTSPEATRRPVPAAYSGERGDRSSVRRSTTGTLQIRSDFAGTRSTPASRWGPGGTSSSSAARSAPPRRGTCTATA